MLDNFKERIKKRRDKKKIRPGRLKNLTANDALISPVNIHIFVEDEESIFRITTREESPELHFDEILFRLETDEKKMKITANFKQASQERSFFIYDFLIKDFREYFA